MPYTVARIIYNIAPKRLTDPEFWEGNVPWYELWLRHNDYHGPVKDVLAARASAWNGGRGRLELG